MPRSDDRRSQFDREVDAALDWMESEARKGRGEFRRDALYAPFHIPAGAWDMDEQLDRKMRRAKDRGAVRVPRVEMVYVYDRPPVWTVQPSPYVRDKYQEQEIIRELSAQLRHARCFPNGHNQTLASGIVKMLDASATMLGVADAPPKNDPVIARIDAAGIAN